MKKGFLIAFVYCVLFLSACATTPETSQDVAARATARMNLVIAGELLEAYEYLSPGYRSSVGPGAYLQNVLSRRVKWTNSQLLGAQCNDNYCTVRHNVEFVVHSPVPGVREFPSASDIEENWVKLKGQWWYLPKN